MKRHWECDLGHEMAFQPKARGNPLRSGLGKGSEDSSDTGQCVWGGPSGKWHRCPQGILEQHTGVRHPLLVIHPLQPRHTVVLSPQ